MIMRDSVIMPVIENKVVYNKSNVKLGDAYDAHLGECRR